MSKICVIWLRFIRGCMFRKMCRFRKIRSSSCVSLRTSFLICGIVIG